MTLKYAYFPLNLLQSIPRMLFRCSFFSIPCPLRLSRAGSKQRVTSGLRSQWGLCRLRVASRELDISSLHPIVTLYYSRVTLFCSSTPLQKSSGLKVRIGCDYLAFGTSRLKFNFQSLPSLFLPLPFLPSLPNSLPAKKKKYRRRRSSFILPLSPTQYGSSVNSAAEYPWFSTNSRRPRYITTYKIFSDWKVWMKILLPQEIFLWHLCRVRIEENWRKK